MLLKQASSRCFMDINFLKDHMFDLLNESDLLNIQDIVCNDLEGTFEITVEDGTKFLITCEKI